MSPLICLCLPHTNVDMYLVLNAVLHEQVETPRTLSHVVGDENIRAQSSTVRAFAKYSQSSGIGQMLCQI